MHPDGQAAPDLVGVFVNEEADFVNAIVEQAGLDIVQLHGTESSEFCQQIRRPVIKALHIKKPDDLEGLIRYQEAAWRCLLDTPTPNWGGTGQTHDWELAQRAARTHPIILSGGLTPENVREALQQVRPWGVDVSSGVESDKQKDPAKIRVFIEQVRSNA